MNIDDRLGNLKSITPVEAPPFLYTRVQQAIDSLKNPAAPVRWRWAFTITAILIVLINVVVVTKSSQTKNSGIEQVVKAMQLSSSNDLYHE